MSLNITNSNSYLCLQADEERVISQYHYTSWPDEGVPDTGTALIRYIRRVRKDAAKISSQPPPPIVVHCRYWDRDSLFLFCTS